jgi:hypothetical protein
MMSPENRFALFGIKLHAHDPTKWNRFVDKIMRKVLELERDLSENRVHFSGSRSS